MGQRVERHSLTFRGRLHPAAFSEFVRRRAARLDLWFRISEATPGLFAIEVAGQPDLIDAFEMACTLGPIDCLVDGCERRRIDPVRTGEALR